MLDPMMNIIIAKILLIAISVDRKEVVAVDKVELAARRKFGCHGRCGGGSTAHSPCRNPYPNPLLLACQRSGGGGSASHDRGGENCRRRDDDLDERAAKNRIRKWRYELHQRANGGIEVEPKTEKVVIAKRKLVGGADRQFKGRGIVRRTTDIPMPADLPDSRHE